MKFRPHVLTLACVLLGGQARASDEGVRRVSLAATLDTLFRSSPAFSVYAAQTRDAGGALLRVSGAFDLVATAGVQVQRTLWPSVTGAMSDTSYTDALAQAGASLRTRENVAIQVSGSVPFTSSIDQGTSPDQPQVSGSLTIPLLKLGRAAGPSADERAAALLASASGAVQEDSESDLTAQVAESYWSWVSSYEQWKVASRLEGLAVAQLRDVDELIANHARPQVDRLAFAAAAEDAAAVTAQAEQLVFARRQQVWEKLGLARAPGDEVPMDALPAVSRAPLDAHAIANWAKGLARQRPLLAALDDEVKAATVRMTGARIAERPDVNLVGQGTAARVDPLYGVGSPRLAYYGMAGLQFSFPVQNRAARGAYESAAAAHDESSLNAMQQKAAIDTRLDVLGRALSTLVQTFQERTVSTEQFRQEYEATRTRFRFGSATATDVVVAEQQYTRASLALVDDNASYASTLAALVHEAGVLNGPVQARDSVSAVATLTNSRF